MKLSKKQSANYLADIMSVVVESTGVPSLSKPVVESAREGGKIVYKVILKGQPGWFNLDIFNGVHMSHVGFFINLISEKFGYDVLLGGTTVTIL